MAITYGFFNRDHPRTCGEKQNIEITTDAESGSPPHMRGKVTKIVKTANVFWDHPRTCGEKFYVCFCNSCRTGSPPHMRGKVCVNFVISIPARITPAHAGKSYFPYSQLNQYWDHPRTCGEKADSALL